MEYVLPVIAGIGGLTLTHFLWPDGGRDTKQFIHDLTLTQVGNILTGALCGVLIGFVIAWVLEKSGFGTDDTFSFGVTVTTGIGLYLLGAYFSYNIGIHSQKTKTDSSIQALQSWLLVSAAFGEQMYTNRDQSLREVLTDFKTMILPPQQPKLPLQTRPSKE